MNSQWVLEWKFWYSFFMSHSINYLDKFDGEEMVLS